MVSTDEIGNAIRPCFDYPVLFADDVLHPDSALLADLCTTVTPDLPARAVVFVDEGLHTANPDLMASVQPYFDAHPHRVRLVTSPQIAVGGEAAKRDLCVVEQCVRVLHDHQLDRHSYVVAIGGGAMLDAVGFAAAIFHRGVRLIRIPTTVLAQNDAGIGVKNGIDYLGRKNLLGCFAPPHAVINDFTLLRTLPAVAWRDGTAEAVKVALIRDPAFFGWIESHAGALAQRHDPEMRQLIRRCAELHLAQLTTSGDPFEMGSARPLDFGHWSAHKLEQLSQFRISHGHAVAIGIAIDVVYSNATGLLDDITTGRVIACLHQLGFDLEVGPRAGMAGADELDSLLDGVREFQEHLGGRLCLTMLRQIGVPVEIGELDMGAMRQCCQRIVLGPQPSTKTTCPLEDISGGRGSATGYR